MWCMTLNEHHRYSLSALLLVRGVAAAFACVGWWFILHGGGSLVGLFTFERFLRQQRGETVPAEPDFYRELALGVCIFTIALALYYKAKSLQSRGEEAGQDQDNPT